MKRAISALLIFLGACSGGSSQPPRIEPRADGAPFAFAAIGDFGTGGDVQSEVAEEMCAWHDEHPLDLVVTTGDNVYPAGQPESFRRALHSPYGCLTQRGVPFHASLGNHDVITDNGFHVLNEPFLGMEGEANYVVRRGGVRFLMADSNDIDTEWLESELAAGERDRWTVVVFHHPVFSAGKHGSTPGFSELLVPLFTEYGVDLVLNGHDHLYSTTEELGGARYVVTGGGGAPLYECGRLEVLEECIEQHHFLYITVTRDKLVVSAISDEGERLDSFTLDR